VKAIEISAPDPERRVGFTVGEGSG